MHDLCSATMNRSLQAQNKTDRGQHSAARAADLTSCGMVGPVGAWSDTPKALTACS